MVTQNAQMKHKVAVVDEVRTRIGDASASIVSEYRGLTVAELKELRITLAAVGGDYRIFKNTLVRRAIDGGEYQPLSEYLNGPSALTFVQGDVSAVAKALKDFARSNPLLVIKGGLADGSLLSSSDLAALADLPRAMCCWPASPAPWRRRCNRWPDSCRRCRGALPTGSPR